MKYKPYLMKDVYAGEALNKFRVISTFAGGGGSSTGYRLAGGKILAINEFVEEARNTYRDNYPNTPILDGDIKELTGKDFLDITKLKEGELDLLDGSPPCSAFSMCGTLAREGTVHSDGFGKTKQYSDGKTVTNIEDLFFEFLRVAEVIRPKTIIAENVEGLTVGEAKQYFNKIQNTFEDIGYQVVAKVHDCSQFGVPQRRRRVFFMAVRDDIMDKVGLNFMTLSSLFPTPNKTITTLEGAFDGLEYDKEEVAMLTEKWKETAYYKQTCVLMPRNPKKVITGTDYHPKGWHFNLKIASEFQPSPTITAMGATEKTAGVCHWNDDRKFTLGELKRVTSLPDDFKLTGKWAQKSERCGRMVPSLMMAHLADSMYKKVISKI
tara:strand:- start:9217 stop:10353 length:1137 start_codon:yes stop_codon:yes gene_type:complete